MHQGVHIYAAFRTNVHIVVIKIFSDLWYLKATIVICKLSLTHKPKLFRNENSLILKDMVL